MRDNAIFWEKLEIKACLEKRQKLLELKEWQGGGWKILATLVWLVAKEGTESRIFQED